MGKIINLLKKIYYRITSRIKNSQVDKDAAISYRVKFYNSDIGRGSYVSNDCNVFYTHIGQFTSIGLGCNIGGGEHPLNWVSTSPVFTAGRTFDKEYANLEFAPYKETFIGNDVYIGACAIIKTGTRIADGAVVGAGAVVTKDIGPYEIWAGNPARFIRKRFDDDLIEKMLETEWWDWPDLKLKELGNYFNDVKLFLKKTQGGSYEQS